MRIVLLFVALIAIGVGTACGGGGGNPDDEGGGNAIPADVEWTVLGERPAFREGWNYYLKLNKPVSDDVLEAIGEKYKKEHEMKNPLFDPKWGSVVVWFYLPDDEPPYINAGAWRTVRLNPGGIEIDKRSY